MTKDEALKLALEALEKLNVALEQADCSTGYCCCGSSVDGHTFGDGHSPVDEGEYCQSNALEYARKATTAIKQALAAPVQEPVAVIGSDFQLLYCREDWAKGLKVGDTLCLCTPPAQRTWVSLTDEEIAAIYLANTDKPLKPDWLFARAIEAKLKEKNDL
jgi:hypothetical protein